MNKNKTADAQTLRTYFLSDKRYLIKNAKRNAAMKRTLRRMQRRTSKAIINAEVE